MNTPSIVCCAEIADPQWRWLEKSLADTGLRFDFARCIPKTALERRFRIINLARLRGCFQAVRLAHRDGTKALVAHGPTLAAWCALFARVFRLKVPIVAHSFNFTELPRRMKRPLFAAAMTRVNRFVVFSQMERDIYAKAFGLPIDRFDVVRWGVQTPRVDETQTPFEQGRYVCAIGGNARDYLTLVAAARQMPDVPFVLVVRPDSLRGIDLPLNCRCHTNLPLGKTMNVLLHSQFMVLPLLGSEVPCGHVTLVAAMHLGKAVVITDSSGVSDYVRNGENGLTVTAGSVESLVAATRRLWDDPELRDLMAENGQRFAKTECTEERVAEHFRGWLRSQGLSKVRQQTDPQSP